MYDVPMQEESWTCLERVFFFGRSKGRSSQKGTFVSFVGLSWRHRSLESWKMGVRVFSSVPFSGAGLGSMVGSSGTVGEHRVGLNDVRGGTFRDVS